MMITLSKQAAEAVEYVKREGYDYATIMKIQITNGWDRKETTPLNELSLKQLSTALIVGYEIEKTPHEVITLKYNTSQDDYVYNQCPYSKGVADGIEFTINTLGVKIKGVNDNE